MPTIIAAIDDLMFQSRLESTARALGHDIVIADTTDLALTALQARPAVLVIDLHPRSLDWRAVVAAAKVSGVPVLAFGRHTEPALLREARAAGCARVVPRSQFVEDLAELLGELSGSPPSTSAPAP